MALSPLPDPRGVEGHEARLALRLAALDQLVDTLTQHLEAEAIAGVSALEDLSLRHLAKATGTTRAALRLMRDGFWSDACILTRAVFEQLFGYLWVVQDPQKADTRNTMVTIKQEWANAKYLEGLAQNAEPAARAELLEEAAAYKAIAEQLLARLAAQLGTSEKKVRDEAKLRVSAKAIEVNLGPRYSIPYARYSGFAHSDGNALAAYGAPGAGGMHYSARGAMPEGVPLASDLHHALLRLAAEVRSRCVRLEWPGLDGALEAHQAWLSALDGA